MKPAREMDDKEFRRAVNDAGFAILSLIPRDCQFILCIIPEDGDPRFATTIPRERIVAELRKVIADYTDKENK